MDLANFIVANNGTNYDYKLLSIKSRLYPVGIYYVIDVHIDNDVDA